MIVDSSVLCALAFREPGFEIFEAALAVAEDAMMGAPTAVEAAMVIGHRLAGAGGEVILGALLDRFEIEVVPFAEGDWPVAVIAYARFGRGRHPAGLNFGDCLTYALAANRDVPLLFKGEDFSRTDLRNALG